MRPHPVKEKSVIDRINIKKDNVFHEVSWLAWRNVYYDVYEKIILINNISSIILDSCYKIYKKDP